MLTVVYCTRKSNPEHTKHIQSTSGLYKGVEVIEIINNGESLTKAYNRGLKQAKNDIIVFCHDDIIFNKNNWGRKLLKYFKQDNELTILGIAGTTFLSPTGKWWDIPSTMIGTVKHQRDGKEWVSQYSPNLGAQLTPVVLVDGLFFAVDKTRLKQTFNEEVEGFHFYDVEFCLDNFINGAKICVTYEIDVTHKSIGETNSAWEENRIKFSDKRKDILPISITNVDLDTYIFVHNQDIVKTFEKSSKFKQLKNYKYVFLGHNPCNEIEGLPNVIIARNLPVNLENYPKFTAFTGWYALWKNNLLTKGRQILLLEYDVHLADNFSEYLIKHINKKYPMVGFVPLPMTNYHFIENPNWVQTVNEAIKKVYRVDIVNALRKQIKMATERNATPIWPTTNNIMMSYDNFIKYMKWFEPLINEIKNDINCGHAQERCLTFFSFMMHINYEFLPNILKHEQLDSHKTQGHAVDFENAIKRLT